MLNKTVLAVDDDPKILKLLRQYLEEDGYRIFTAETGKAAMEILKTQSPSVVLLDLVLPDTDGLALMRQIQASTDIPVIVISGKGDATDKVVGLELGADDYISKPFHLREVVARIKSVLRRVELAGQQPEKGAGNDNRILQFDGWTMDTGKFELTSPDRTPVDLTTSEFQLLQTLAESHNRVMSRERLFEITRNDNYDSFDRAIDIQIGRLRKKLNDDPKSPRYIKTIRGVGYMFVGNVEKSA
jgi:two-component system, OmpR family, response regulator